MASISMLLRTVRHLRPSQVLWRLRYAAEHRLDRPRGRWAWRSAAPPPVRDDLPPVPRLPSSSLTRPPALRDLARGVFDLLHRSVEIGYERPDWRLGPRSSDRLWTVSLHYHEWVDALARIARCEKEDGGAEEAAALLRHYLSDWIRRCGLEQPGARALAWNVYAIATRLGWWIRAYGGAGARILEPGSELERSFLGSLWQQATYLSDHLEWDLRGNHLMRDAVGLAWAGRFFRGSEPRAWLRRATTLALEQIDEQVLPDGGHFERSPRYHVEIMEDLMVLALLLEDPGAVAEIRRTWSAMAEVLAWMRHPDGDIPLFNDAALLGSDAPAALLGLGERIGVPADASPRRGGRHFVDSGLAVWHGAPWSLFFDVGPVGPDFQPGHAHADTLTIECSFQGRRLFVDPGTFSYDDDERRRYDRGTEAHNTVCIDDADSSEVWKIFRVGRRARPFDVAVDFRADGMSASGSHDGYDHLRGRPRHRREVEVREKGALVLVDRATGAGTHRIRGGLLVEPSWTVEETAGGWRLADGGHRLRVVVESARTLERSIERRPYHPRYGVERQATRIGWRWRGDLPLEVRTVVEPG